jgi:hypothetical protein
MEQNESMFAAMRHLANETWDGVETYTWDWREFLPELEGTIDLVLADGSLNMLNFPGEWELALSNVRRYLRVPGRLVCRIACQLRGSFDFDSYLDATLAAFERSSASSSPAERSTCFRQLLSEVRLATAFGALDASGCVDLDQRATLTGRAHSRLAARYANWQTWSRFSIALNTEQGVRQGVNTSKGVPTLRSAARLMEACGLTSIRAETHVVRPARGAMRIVSAERM